MAVNEGIGQRALFSILSDSQYLTLPMVNRTRGLANTTIRIIWRKVEVQYVSITWIYAKDSKFFFTFLSFIINTLKKRLYGEGGD